MSSSNVEPEPEPSTIRPGLAKHERVRHPDFGRGYVVQVMGHSCMVFFLQDGKRRQLKQDKLERCS